MLEPARRRLPKRSISGLSGVEPGGKPTRTKGAKIPQESQFLVKVVRRAHCIQDEVERLGKIVERTGLPCGDESIGAQAIGVFLLVARRAEHRDFCPHGSRELHRHVAQTTETY